jgi:hypothetical protein
MLVRAVAGWVATHELTLAAVIWMAVLLGVLIWLHGRQDGIFLVLPPFAATMAIVVWLPNISIAQPFAVILSSTSGAAIGTVLGLLVGSSPGVAILAALAAAILLPLLRAYQPPGVALAVYPTLLHLRSWFSVEVVLPFTLPTGISAAILSRFLRSWPRYPAPLRIDSSASPAGS